MDVLDILRGMKDGLGQKVAHGVSRASNTCRAAATIGMLCADRATICCQPLMNLRFLYSSFRARWCAASAKR